MTHKRRIGRERVSNCWLVVALLLLRGRLRGVVLVWESALPHAVGITRRSNAVHFRRTRGKARTCSLWLTGRVEVASEVLFNCAACSHRTTRILYRKRHDR